MVVDSRGPVFYQQTRVGKDGVVFYQAGLVMAAITGLISGWAQSAAHEPEAQPDDVLFVGGTSASG